MLRGLREEGRVEAQVLYGGGPGGGAAGRPGVPGEGGRGRAADEPQRRVQEALELWLEVKADEDRERMTRLSDRIEATQELIGASTERLARMVYMAHLKSEMAIQMLREASGKASEVEREAIRGRAAKILDSERRREAEARRSGR